MKFLSKKNTSEILAENLTYKKNNSANNKRLKILLLKEQNGFCAYSELYLDQYEREGTDVEHFNETKKYSDDYFNYYAVCSPAHRFKTRKQREEKFKRLFSENTSFFSSLFFQNPDIFNTKIAYSNGEYYSIDENDKESLDFIEYLGLNDSDLSNKRAKYINRLRLLFDNLNHEQQLNHLREHISDLKFSTAIESVFDLDLSEIIQTSL